MYSILFLSYIKKLYQTKGLVDKPNNAQRLLHLRAPKILLAVDYESAENILKIW